MSYFFHDRNLILHFYIISPLCTLNMTALFRNPSIFSAALNLHFENRPWYYVNSISYKVLVEVDINYEFK